MTSIVSVFCKMSESSPRLTLSLPGRGDMETQPTISYLNVPGIQHNCHGMAMSFKYVNFEYYIHNAKLLPYCFDQVLEFDRIL